MKPKEINLVKSYYKESYYKDFNLAFERTDPQVFYLACKDGKRKVIEILFCDQRINSKLDINKACRNILEKIGNEDEAWELVSYLRLNYLSPESYFYAKKPVDYSDIGGLMSRDCIEEALKYLVHIENEDLLGQFKIKDEEDRKEVTKSTMHLAVYEGNLKVVQYLIDKYDIPYNKVPAYHFLIVNYVYDQLKTEEAKRQYLTSSLDAVYAERWHNLDFFKWRIEKSTEEENYLFIKSLDGTILSSVAKNYKIEIIEYLFEIIMKFDPKKKNEIIRIISLSDGTINSIKFDKNFFYYIMGIHKTLIYHINNDHEFVKNYPYPDGLELFKATRNAEIVNFYEKALETDQDFYESKQAIDNMVNIYQTLRNANFPISKLKYVRYFASDIYPFLRSSKNILLDSKVESLPLELQAQILFQYVSSVGDELTPDEKWQVIFTMQDIIKDTYIKVEETMRQKQSKEFEYLLGEPLILPKLEHSIGEMMEQDLSDVEAPPLIDENLWMKKVKKESSVLGRENRIEETSSSPAVKNVRYFQNPENNFIEKFANRVISDESRKNSVPIRSIG